MYDYHNPLENVTPNEVLVYLRKSRTDDPLMSVEEVLAKHETILDEWAEKTFGEKIKPENKFHEIVSGETIADRVEFQKILKRIESPKIRAVAVVEIARLGRPDMEEIGKITKIFRYTDTLVITPMKTFDLTNEYDRDMFERELKRGNEFLEYQKKIMNRGRLLAVSQGNFVGNCAPYGYRKVEIQEGKRKCHSLEIVEREAEVVRMIFDMYVNQNMGRQIIAHRLDQLHIKPPKGEHWSANTIRDMLDNVHYIGKVKWYRRKTITTVEDGEIMHSRPKNKYGDYLVFDGKHPAIISEELFQSSLDKIGKSHRAKATTKIRNPLAGLLWCSCGRAMNYRAYPKSDGTERSSARLICAAQTHCNTGSCTYDEMIEIIVGVLRQKIKDYQVEIKESNEDKVKFHAQTIKTLEKRLADLEEKEVLQWEAQFDPDVSKRLPHHIFKSLNAKLLQEKEDVTLALEQALTTMPEPVNFEKRLITLQDALNALTDPEMSAEEQNKFLKACIEHIEYHRDRPQRVKKQDKQPRKRDKKTGKTITPNPMPIGGSWTNPPIHLDIKLKV